MQMFSANKRPFGRLKFTQATVERDLEPIYRYPTNNQSACLTHSWTPTAACLNRRKGNGVECLFSTFGQGAGEPAF